MSRSGTEVADNLRELLQRVYLKHEPVCVLADGLNVLDDMGGIWGYYDFLTVINGTD